uniref:Uncharacterized protein n=1 Tax=Oryza meridionalis TaxID=40149 RepID=A0A0E0CIM3_9ORYZ
MDTSSTAATESVTASTSLGQLRHLHRRPAVASFVIFLPSPCRCRPRRRLAVAEPSWLGPAAGLDMEQGHDVLLRRHPSGDGALQRRVLHRQGELRDRVPCRPQRRRAVAVKRLDASETGDACCGS